MSNAPTKVKMVNDAMMAKWEGKYELLYNNLVKKYGPLGEPISQEPDFAAMIRKETPVRNEEDLVKSGIDAKLFRAFNGLSTSTFTVCARIRPKLPFDDEGGGDKSDTVVTIVPGQVHKDEGAEGEYSEDCLVFSPSMSITGKARLTSEAMPFDHTFGPATDPAHLYQAVGEPLVAKAMAGQVGVVFAYGQTGSGKTYTMNSLMESVSSEIFGTQATEGRAKSKGSGPREISFSYLEVCGDVCTDCLDSAAEEGGVQIGEMLDGRVLTRNLTSHACASVEELHALVELAKSKRKTAATERNEQSSRSHGIGIIEIGPDLVLGDADSTLPRPAAGKLLMIDLAGSERAADAKNHTDAQLEERKAINVSLMSLKECIRARTIAGTNDGRREVHIPYRRSKLTLLMKDVFDISCRRLCSTVVLAHVSPINRDTKHSVSTLQYAAPLRVAVKDTIVTDRKYEKDPLDPALWDHAQVVSWLASVDAGLNVQYVIHDTGGAKAGGSGDTSGFDLCTMSEASLFVAVSKCFTDDESKARTLASSLYNALWTMICDAKVRRRRGDGSIITAEQAAAEIANKARLAKEKAELWQSREAHLKSER